MIIGTGIGGLTTDSYKESTGFHPDALNSRPSPTPPGVGR